MRNPINLARDELVEIATGLLQILYGVEHPDGSWTYACDKEWSGGDVCQDAAMWLAPTGLCPTTEGEGEFMEGVSMNNVTLVAADYNHARGEYDRAFREHFHNEVQPLSTDDFWELQPVFTREVYVYRFHYGRTNGVEQAAQELFRKPLADDFGGSGEGAIPRYFMDQATRFARSWREQSRQLYEPLFGVVEGRGDDAYGDLLDSLPMAGREVFDKCRQKSVSSNAEFEQLISGACQDAGRPQFADFILRGENYISMSLTAAAQEYLAASTDSQ